MWSLVNDVREGGLSSGVMGQERGSLGVMSGDSGGVYRCLMSEKE